MLHVYNTEVNNVIHAIGTNGITYNDQLENFCKRVIPQRFNFLGVFPQDFDQCIINRYTQCCLIFNTSQLSQEGVHWMALWKENNKKFMYDSFGRNPSKLVPFLNRGLNGGVYYEDEPEQKNKESNCGQRSIAWLLCCVKYGIKNAIKI